jgi:hypothetical protein
LEEELVIAKDTSGSMLNRRRELMNKCLHKEPYKLSNFYSHHLQQAQPVDQDVHHDQLPLVDQDQLVDQDVQLVQDDVQIVHAEHHVQVVDHDEQLVHVHDGLAVSATQLTPEPPDQGLPRRSSVVDQDAQPLLVDQEEQLAQPAYHVHDALVASANELQPEPLDRVRGGYFFCPLKITKNGFFGVRV